VFVGQLLAAIFSGALTAYLSVRILLARQGQQITDLHDSLNLLKVRTDQLAERIHVNREGLHAVDKDATERYATKRELIGVVELYRAGEQANLKRFNDLGADLREGLDKVHGRVTDLAKAIARQEGRERACPPPGSSNEPRDGQRGTT
jgi:hypothetical protein